MPECSAIDWIDSWTCVTGENSKQVISIKWRARVCVCVLPSVCFAWVKNWIVGENKLSQVTWPSYWHSPNLMGSIINVGHFPTYWARRASGTVRWRDWGFDISQIASDWSSPLPHRKKEMKRDKWISSPLQKCSPPSLLPQPCHYAVYVPIGCSHRLWQLVSFIQIFFFFPHCF